MQVMPIGTLAECVVCHVWHDVAFEEAGKTYCFSHAPTNMNRDDHIKYLRNILIGDGTIC